MSHGHEKTLLSAMGFQDPDRKKPLHTLACQYLMRPEIIKKLWSRVHVRRLKDPVIPASGIHAEAEARVTRDARYLLGFWDVVLFPRDGSCCAAIEVKTTPTDVAEIARQIAALESGRIYTLAGTSDWTQPVLATTYPLSVEDKNLLLAKGISTIWLGEPFQAYVRERQTAPAPVGEDGL